MPHCLHGEFFIQKNPNAWMFLELLLLKPSSFAEVYFHFHLTVPAFARTCERRATHVQMVIPTVYFCALLATGAAITRFLQFPIASEFRILQLQAARFLRKTCTMSLHYRYTTTTHNDNGGRVRHLQPSLYSCFLSQ